MAERPGVLFYFDLLPALEKLKAEDVGALFLAAMHYGEDGKGPMFTNPSLDFAWALIRPLVDRDGAAYQEKRDRGAWLVYCRKCKQNGVEPLPFDDWRQRTVNGALSSVNVPSPSTYSYSSSESESISKSNIIGADKPPKRPCFVPPSVEEVRAYCQERKNRVDAERFVDFYQARGWMLGKNRMKDWRAAVRTWEREDRDGSVSGATATTSGDTSRWGKLKSVQLD